MEDPTISLEDIAKILTSLYLRFKSLKYSYSNYHSKPMDSKIDIGGVNQLNTIGLTIVQPRKLGFSTLNEIQL